MHDAGVVGPGMDTEAVVSGLNAAGFQRRYQRQLGLPSRPGASPSQLRTFVTPYVIEYASVEGAAAGFALLETEVADVGMKDVLGTRTIGDRSETTRFRRSTDNGELFRALDLTFQIDNLVAGVTLGEFGGREPDLATVESLGELLLVKIRRGQAEGGPGLSNVVLRLEGPDIETRADEYGRLDGQTLRNYGETPDELVDRAERYGDAVVVYGVGQSIDRGSPARSDDTRYGVLLYQFASEQDAAGWLESGVERAEQSPNIIEAIPVAGTATIGEASETLAIASERSGAGTARGYLIETQLGARTAQVQILGIPDVPLAAVEALARAQVACLQAGACAGQALPTSLGEPGDACRLTRAGRTLEHAAILLGDWRGHKQSNCRDAAIATGGERDGEPASERCRNAAKHRRHRHRRSRCPIGCLHAQRANPPRRRGAHVHQRLRHDTALLPLARLDPARAIRPLSWGPQ